MQLVFSFWSVEMRLGFSSQPPFLYYSYLHAIKWWSGDLVRITWDVGHVPMMRVRVDVGLIIEVF